MPPEVDKLLTQCESDLKSRNYEEAIAGCRAVLNLAPEHPRAKEMLDEAQSKLEAELFVRENLRKAQDAFQNRDFQKCVNECQKIQLLDPDNPSVQELLSKAQEKLEAEPFIQNFVNSGQSLFDSGLYSEAIAQWEKVRSIDPMYPGLDDLIQSAREKGGMADEAPAFEFSADSSGPEIGLSLEPSAEGEGFGGGFGEESDEDSDQKINRLLKEGDKQLRAGDPQRAIEIWSEIFLIDVSNVEALQRIENARSPDAVIPPAPEEEEQVETEEGSLEDLMARGNAAEEAGEYREAAQFFSQALAIDAENAELADKIKNLNMLAKKQDRGRTVLGNARAFMEEGKLESARHALSKILEADPENEEALEMMRELKGKAGTTLEARPAVAAPRPSARIGSPIPVIPAAIVAGVLAIGAAAFFMFGKSEKKDPPKVVKVEKKTPAKTTNSGNTQTPAATVSPEAKEAAEKVAQEAAFYFNEKHDPEAIQKANEALKLDPGNSLAKSTKAASEKRIKEAVAAERKLLDDANQYFEYSDFAGAVRLYEKYIEGHPETVNDIQPQIIKCYYNLGVISIRQWKCDTAADYFRQVLFIDENDVLSKDALALARKCQQVGSSDLEMRKQVTFLEMRK